MKQQIKCKTKYMYKIYSEYIPNFFFNNLTSIHLSSVIWEWFHVNLLYNSVQTFVFIVYRSETTVNRSLEPITNVILWWCITCQQALKRNFSHFSRFSRPFFSILKVFKVIFSMIFKVFKFFFCKFHLNIVPSEARPGKINNANFVFSLSSFSESIKYICWNKPFILLKI